MKSKIIITFDGQPFIEELKPGDVISFTHPDGSERYGIIQRFRFSNEHPPTGIFYEWFRYSPSRKVWYWHQSEIVDWQFHEYKNFKIEEGMTQEQVEDAGRAAAGEGPTSVPKLKKMTRTEIIDMIRTEVHSGGGEDWAAEKALFEALSTGRTTAEEVASAKRHAEGRQEGELGIYIGGRWLNGALSFFAKKYPQYAAVAK